MRQLEKADMHQLQQQPDFQRELQCAQYQKRVAQVEMSACWLRAVVGSLQSPAARALTPTTASGCLLRAKPRPRTAWAPTMTTWRSSAAATPPTWRAWLLPLLLRHRAVH